MKIWSKFSDHHVSKNVQVIASGKEHDSGFLVVSATLALCANKTSCALGNPNRKAAGTKWTMPPELLLYGTQNLLLHVPRGGAVIPSVGRHGGTASKSSEPKSRPSLAVTTPPASFSRRLSEQVFDAADIDHDGEVDFDEVYELTLRLYILVNRQAPIPPPSRETVWGLFVVSDTDNSRVLNKTEFVDFSTILLERALSRMLAFKMVTLVGAPLLTEYVIHWWTSTPRPWLPHLVARFVSNPHYLALLTSKGFCRTVLLIIFISTLGNLVLTFVDSILKLWLSQQKRELFRGIQNATANKQGSNAYHDANGIKFGVEPWNDPRNKPQRQGRQRHTGRNQLFRFLRKK